MATQKQTNFIGSLLSELENLEYSKEYGIWEDYASEEILDLAEEWKNLNSSWGTGSMDVDKCSTLIDGLKQIKQEMGI